MISYCKNGKSAQVLACPQEKLNEILDSPEVAVACQKLTTVDHDSDEAKTLKQGLPLLMFFANYTDGRRHAKSAVPTNMAYLDLDELNGEDPREAWKRLVQKLVSMELEHLIVLVHVSCSGKGLRIVYIIPSQFDHLSPTERIDQSKQWLAAQLGVIDDSKTRDLARGSFAVPRSYVLYGPDKRLFEESVSESVKQEIIAADYRTNRTLISGTDPETTSGKTFPNDYHGIPFSVTYRGRPRYTDLSVGLRPKAYLRTFVRVARSGDSLLRRVPVGREACEDQKCPCVGVQWLPAAPEKCAESLGCVP